jgi:hypothetical protein
MNTPRTIRLNLTHGKDYGNDLFVRGDKKWVSDVFEDLNDYLGSISHQPELLFKYKPIILSLLALLIGYSIVNVLDSINYPSGDPNSKLIQSLSDIVKNYPFVYYIILLFRYWISGIVPAIYLRQQLFKLWPNVEFDFGPEQKKLEKNAEFY